MEQFHEECYGKRLLIIGCANNAEDVCHYCRKNGIIVVAAGHPLSDKITAIADEFYDINILEPQIAVPFIREKRIDGVFVGGNEDVISAVIDISEEAGLPFYANRRLWDITSNKKEFKKACMQYDIPVTKEYIIGQNPKNDIVEIEFYPAVLKPVDSCGSQGVCLCQDQSELEHCLNKAKGESKSGEVIAEEYVTGQEVVVYYTFCDGKVTLSSMCDKFLRLGGNGFNPISEVYRYPSIYLNEFCQKLDKPMRKMLLSMGICNGITSMQAIYTDDGEFKFFEMGYRLGGTAQYRYTKLLNGISSFEMMMKYALTGKMDQREQEKDNPFFDKICCTLSLLSKGGTVGKICGLSEAQKTEGVICVENRYKTGDIIETTGTVSQIHIRLFLVADTTKGMEGLIKKVQSMIKVYNDEGKSMLITNFDVDRLYVNLKNVRGGAKRESKRSSSFQGQISFVEVMAA